MPLNQAILDRTESFRGLYDPSFEHDACGVGLVASIKGVRSNAILKKALTCVCNLIHRGAMDADARILPQAPVQLPVAHIHRDHFARPVLQQAIGEATG